MDCLPDLFNLKTVLVRLKLYFSISPNVERKPDLDLPFDVILQIISRLPAKSLGRFKCVCKSWCVAIQDDRNFIEMHMRHSKPINIYNKKTSDDGPKKLWDSVDGLLLEENLLRKEYYLCNPTTKEKFTIPSPHRHVRHIKASYIQSSGSYKLIHVYVKKGTEIGGCKVLHIGTDVEWRSLEIPNLQSYCGERGETSKCLRVNEVCFVLRLFVRDSHLSEIIYIEMDTEHFGNIKIPQGFLTGSRTNVGCVSWEKKLALADKVNHEIHLWVLEDFKKQKWADSKIVVSLSFLRDNPLLESPSPWCTVMGGCLRYKHDKYIVAFHIESKTLRVLCAPPDSLFSCCIYSSLVSVRGKQK